MAQAEDYWVGLRSHPYLPDRVTIFRIILAGVNPIKLF
jgi:hypothetical protein